MQKENDLVNISLPHLVNVRLPKSRNATIPLSINMGRTQLFCAHPQSLWSRATTTVTIIYGPNWLRSQSLPPMISGHYSQDPKQHFLFA